jgi:hypothetical protein
MTTNQLHEMALTLAGLLNGGVFAASVEGYEDFFTAALNSGNIEVSGATVNVTATFTSQTDLTITKFRLYDRDMAVVKEREVSISLTGGGEGAFMRWSITTEEE